MSRYKSAIVPGIYASILSPAPRPSEPLLRLVASVMSRTTKETQRATLPLLLASAMFLRNETTAMFASKVFAAFAHALRASPIIGHIDCMAMTMLLIRARRAFGVVDVTWRTTAAIGATIPAVASATATSSGAIFHYRHRVTVAMAGGAARSTLRV